LREAHKEGAQETGYEGGVAQESEGEEWGFGGEVGGEEPKEEADGAEDERDNGVVSRPGECCPAPGEGDEKAC
jgi:hypothetical protein